MHKAKEIIALTHMNNNHNKNQNVYVVPESAPEAILGCPNFYAKIFWGSMRSDPLENACLCTWTIVLTPPPLIW